MLAYLRSNKWQNMIQFVGGEVYLAAAGSNEKSSHFRHRRGNNDKDCERYAMSLYDFNYSVSKKCKASELKENKKYYGEIKR